MRVNQADVFPENNGTKVRKKRKEVWERCRGGNGPQWNVIHFESRHEPANAYTVWRMGVRDYDYLRT